MASPVGHVVVGIGVAGAVAGLLEAGNTPALWVGAGIAACLPDLDVVPILWGVSHRKVHRQASHSILILAPLVLLTWVAAYALPLAVDWRLMAPWTIALASHVALDVLCTGPVLGQQGLGVPLFWPMTPRRWSVIRPIFPEVDLLDGVPPGTIGRQCLQELLRLSPASVALVFLGHLL